MRRLGGHFSFSKHCDMNGSRSGAVELKKQYSLPHAEHELIVFNVECYGSGEVHCFAVRVTIRTFTIAHVFGADGKVIVMIIIVLGGNMVQMFAKIFMEQGFFFIHEN